MSREFKSQEIDKKREHIERSSLLPHELDLVLENLVIGSGAIPLQLTRGVEDLDFRLWLLLAWRYPLVETNPY